VLLRLILLFTLVPFIELALLLWLSDVTSWQTTILIVIVTGVVGAWLARRQGFQTWNKIHAEMAQGKPPAGSLVDALLIFIAGALLLTPGILTDAVGFGLLIPPFRTAIKTYLAARFRGQINMRQSFSGATFWTASPQDLQNWRDEQIIEVEATRKNEIPSD